MLKYKNLIIKNKMFIKYKNPLLYFIKFNKKLLNLNKFINKYFIIKFNNFFCLNCFSKKKKFLEMDIVKNVIL
ncbi:MAG: hypothetical protein NHF93_00585 [Candidatus Shikimatogenerans bostrichidophilus]|nr:MAG: hypothetical protein NHF93_00585 [Candidatus Shikimatogenerans bostrichidophilus]